MRRTNSSACLSSKIEAQAAGLSDAYSNKENDNASPVMIGSVGLVTGYLLSSTLRSRGAKVAGSRLLMLCRAGYTSLAAVSVKGLARIKTLLATVGGAQLSRLKSAFASAAGKQNLGKVQIKSVAIAKRANAFQGALNSSSTAVSMTRGARWANKLRKMAGYIPKRGRGLLVFILVDQALDFVIDTLPSIYSKLTSGDALTEEEETKLSDAIVKQSSNVASELVSVSEEGGDIVLESPSYQAESFLRQRFADMAALAVDADDSDWDDPLEQRAWLGMRLALSTVPVQLADDEQSRRAIGLAIAAAGAKLFLGQPFAISNDQGLISLEEEHDHFLTGMMLGVSDFGSCVGVVSSDDEDVLEAGDMFGGMKVVDQPLSEQAMKWWMSEN